MDRELLLAILSAALLGPTLLLASAAPTARRDVLSARHLERRCWRRLWAPLLAAALVLAALAGWAVREPDHAEAAPWPLVLIAAPFLFTWLRASWRALRALRAPDRERAPAATHGLLRPRIRIVRELAERLDPSAQRAAWAHEAAHRRRRDPLRIWLAQLATDLQWPSWRAGHRLAEWLDAMEMACDEEARRSGARGEDLAAAVVAAARLGRGTRGGRGGLPQAGLAEASARLERRVQRLLRPLPPENGCEGAPRRVRIGVIVLALLLGAGAVGFLHGEAWVRLLLRIAA